MKMSPFSAPFFWGTQKRGLLLPRRAAALWEGTRWCKGGTGKIGAVSAELCEQAKRNRKNQPCHDCHSSHNGARFKWLLRLAAVTSGWPTIRPNPYLPFPRTPFVDRDQPLAHSGRRLV